MISYPIPEGDPISHEDGESNLNDAGYDHNYGRTKHLVQTPELVELPLCLPQLSKFVDSPCAMEDEIGALFPSSMVLKSGIKCFFGVCDQSQPGF